LADEILFNLFKRNKIKFSQIVSLISQCIKCFRKLEIKNVNDIFLLNDKCDKFINKKIS
jgi:1-deoxy-D-xylulose 5-phosphate reductoisomerase